MLNTTAAFREVVHDFLFLRPLSQHVGLLGTSNVSVGGDMAVYSGHTSRIKRPFRPHAFHDLEGHRSHEVIDHDQVDCRVDQLARFDLVPTAVCCNDLLGDRATHRSVPFDADLGRMPLWALEDLNLFPTRVVSWSMPLLPSDHHPTPQSFPLPLLALALPCGDDLHRLEATL